MSKQQNLLTFPQNLEQRMHYLNFIGDSPLFQHNAMFCKKHSVIIYVYSDKSRLVTSMIQKRDSSRLDINVFKI